MAINPDNITTIRVDQLPEDVISLVNEFAHTNGTELKKATIQSLVDLVAAAVGAGSGVGFLPISVTDGQQLPDVPAEPSFFLAGIGTYLNINGYPDLICTEELNAIMSLTDHWEIAVEIPIAPLSGAVQSVTGSAVDNTDPLNPVINSTGGGGSQSLDEVLAVGSVASMVLTDGSTYDVNLPFDDGFDIYMGDIVTASDNNNQALRIMQFQAINNTINSEVAGVQLSNMNIVSQLFPTSGDYNIIHSSTKIDGADAGAISIEIPTPKTFAPNGQIKYKYPYKEIIGDYTLATIDDIPTNTSDLINDGEDGEHPYITLLDLPSNLILYPTTVASDIVGYVKLVTDIHDVDYDDPAVNVSTGSITTTNQLISSLITVPDLISGNPGVFNISTIGNIRRSAGSGTAEFYFQVYKRDSLGTETLIGVSNPTLPVNNGVYAEFSATAIWDDGVFTATDRIVLKFYGSRIAGGSNPTYEFQFGGLTPVRTLVPIPLSVVPSIPNATETVAGIAEIATTAEVATGTDDERIVTPLKLKAVTDLKVDKTNWINISATSTIVGFATFFVKAIFYKIIDNYIFIDFALEGTSNSTLLTFTVPFNNTGGFTKYNPGGYGVNSGVASNNPPRIGITNNSNLVTCNTTLSGGAYAATGNKGCIGSISFKIN